MPIIITKEHQPAPKTGKAADPLQGKTVLFRLSEKGQVIAGVVKSTDGSDGMVEVALASPNNDGLLVVSKDSTIRIRREDLSPIDAVAVTGRDVKRWQNDSPVEGLKKVEVKDSNGNIIDYRDVTFDGYGSTFQGTTPEDRDGDYILPGAFDKTLKSFRANPVMLTDHTRSVKNLMGSYPKVSITDRGLALSGQLTNSAHPDAVHTRALVAEGHLKTLSIGGMFFYLEDYRGIQEITLYETSLVVVPANPDALFTVRSLDTESAEKAFKHHAKLYGGEVRLKMTA